MRRAAGFTLIELLVVMAIVATLLSIAAPRYFESLKRGEEATLRQNLSILRASIDKHYADAGRYPDALSELVAKRYLRALPVDPFTGSDMSWVTLPPPGRQPGRVYDVKSGASGQGLDGTPYASW